jgi:CrcB protein
MSAAGGSRRRESMAVIGVIALGGAIGSLLRYQAGVIWPTAPGTFPITTLVINVFGCLVIGLFLVVITEVWDAHRLVRPFFGTGVLGGFTTFSTYCLDVLNLVRIGQPERAALYLFLTVIGAMLAVAIGMLGARRLVLARRQP